MAKNQNNSNKPKDYEGTRTCLGILVGIMSLVVVLLIAAWVVRWLHNDEECTNPCEECEPCPEPEPTPNTGEPYAPVINITDEYGNSWDGSSDLNIFFDSEFGGNVIYPYATGTYTFIFDNENDDDVVFTISLSEENEYDIAMMYKLSQDGVIVTPNWLRAKDFTCPELTIKAKGSTTLTLDWWWDGDANDEADTNAAINGMIYTLSITIDGYIERFDDE